MLDLYKEFKDWLDYNHPGVKLEPLQENLMKLALHYWNCKITKTAGRAISKELVKLFSNCCFSQKLLGPNYDSEIK